jgi:hypothetical protein
MLHHLELVVVRSSSHVWPQGQYSLHESQIWFLLIRDLYNAFIFSTVEQYSWSPVPDRQLVTSSHQFSLVSEPIISPVGSWTLGLVFWVWYMLVILCHFPTLSILITHIFSFSDFATISPMVQLHGTPKYTGVLSHCPFVSVGNYLLSEFSHMFLKGQNFLLKVKLFTITQKTQASASFVHTIPHWPSIFR